jgi:outer membrane protein OmpA-like peptidoglycan-associated protein
MSTLRTLAASSVLLALACAHDRRPDSESTPPSQVAAVGASDQRAAGPRDTYLDKQAQELGSIPGAEVTRKDDALVLSMEEGMLFDSSSALLAPGGVERVRSVAHTVASYPKQRLIVKGHTDNLGDERSNQRLSEDRADSVRNLLIAEGVPPSRITAVGLGPSLPLASNSTAEGRQQNRRVEIELRPDAEVMQGEVSQ